MHGGRKNSSRAEQLKFIRVGKCWKQMIVLLKLNNQSNFRKI